MKFMSDFREAMWGVVQTVVSELDFDFDGYAHKHFERMLETAADPRLRRPGSRRRVSPRAELPDSARCVIIGGGVGGTSIAYHLAKLGYDDVVLLERAELTSGSTFHSAGPGRPAARLGHADEDDDALGRGLPRASRPSPSSIPGWVECGGIRLASSEERMEELRRQAGWAKTFGLPLELISAEEAKERFPLMSTEGVLGAAWLPTDGYIDPSQLTYALADVARREGGLQVFQNTRGDRDRGRRRPRARGRDREGPDRGRGRGQRRRDVRGRDRPPGRASGCR